MNRITQLYLDNVLETKNESEAAHKTIADIEAETDFSLSENEVRRTVQLWLFKTTAIPSSRDLAEHYYMVVRDELVPKLKASDPAKWREIRLMAGTSQISLMMREAEMSDPDSEDFDPAAHEVLESLGDDVGVLGASPDELVWDHVVNACLCDPNTSGLPSEIIDAARRKATDATKRHFSTVAQPITWEEIYLADKRFADRFWRVGMLSFDYVDAPNSEWLADVTADIDAELAGA